MKYIISSSCVVETISFGAEVTCGSESCVEYTGAVPTGYDSLEDWFIKNAEKISQWSIIDGKLVKNSNSPPEEGASEADQVTDTGTSGIWQYRKWASGMIECWGRSETKTANLTTEWGNCYTTQVTSELVGPFELPFALSQKRVQVQPAYAGLGEYWLVPVKHTENLSNIGAYRPVRASESSGVKVAVDIYVVGTAVLYTVTVNDDDMGYGNVYVGELAYNSGMTWAEWCASRYNEYGFYISSSNGLVLNMDGYNLYPAGGTGNYVYRAAEGADPVGGQAGTSCTITHYTYI